MRVIDEDLNVVEIDGLTCDLWLLPTNILDDGCDCTRRHLKSSVRDMALHQPTCSVQPIYASLWTKYDIDVVLKVLRPPLFSPMPTAV